MMEAITRMRPIEFTGLARLLNVQVVEQVEGEEKLQPRDFSDVFGDIMAKYDAMNRQQKRNLLKLVQKSNGA